MLRLTLLAVLAASASAQTPLDMPERMPNQTITVSGQGVVSAPPDRAVVRLGVQTTAPTAAEALRQNEEDVARVLGRVRSFGIADRQIEVEALQLGEDYELRSEDGPQGYRAYRIVSVTIDSLNAVPDLIASVVEGGANRLDGLFYTLQSSARYRDRALDQAMTDARSKAERLAAAAGASLGAVLSVEERGAGVTPVSPGRMQLAASEVVELDANPGAYSAGSSTVRADVVVRYQLLAP